MDFLLFSIVNTATNMLTNAIDVIAMPIFKLNHGKAL